MRPRRLSAVAEAVGGRVAGDDAEVRRVVTDSRLASPGDLFVALKGERADGATFVADAFARGAAGAMVPEGTLANGPTVHVASTGDALLRLGADERARWGGPVVGITGANGKTSTKDLAATVLAARLRVHASPGSFNNEIGLPMTLLDAAEDAEVIVAELGARHVGDATLLCEVARPSVVVVTNVGVAHMEIFGSWDAIVRASAEPVEALGADDIAVLNLDDPVVAGYAERTAARVLTFGRSPAADVRADRVRLGADGRATFDAAWGDEHATVTLVVPGEHMVSNALAALAVGSVFDVPIAAAAASLGTAEVSRWRMETFTADPSVTVLNDAYNANPESMAAALRAARSMTQRGTRLIAVLGEMAELGPIAAQEHERVGELAARLRVDRLVTVGGRAREIAVAAVREGIPPDDVASYEDVADALEDVRRSMRAGDVVLCKGSRVVGLERLAEALR